MKKISRIICLMIFIAFILSSCSAKPSSEVTTLETLAAVSELIIVPSDERVSEFTEKNKDFASSYNTDECCNITPLFISDNSEYSIFKYAASSQSYIMYEDEVYSIGICFGGFGITSMALADMDKDSQYELYYTFSWGSGMHRSQIGYFNPADKKINVFDYALFNSDMMLTVNTAGELCIRAASFDGGAGSSLVDFTVKALDVIGNISFVSDKISLDIYKQD